ncbi:SDR family oxidoreductase [Streptomyces longispororuber]|uniref:SDR family oxidoreductase n=1 Tax=Streptomyces longispororuber TaxID=68230 RepID=UPI001E575B91|nr:SDR family oxidoreductase [Streptomyces longispororuber]
MVTGAGSGIGRAVALELLREGWSVALAGRREEPLRETAELAARQAAERAAEQAGPGGGPGGGPKGGPNGGPEGGPGGGGPGSGPAGGPAAGERTLCVRTDVSAPDDVAALFAAVRERFGPLGLLFNNAGTFGPGGVPVEDLPYDAWRHVVDTNLNGAFLCAQAAFRQMKEQQPQGGRIINNGSVSAHAPRPHSVAYTATKHALTGLTKSLSLDGRPYRIAVGQIDIGNAATDMTARMRSGVLQADGETAVEPVMDVADVARTVRHMAELPLEANVQFATVLATTMPYIGRG